MKEARLSDHGLELRCESSSFAEKGIAVAVDWSVLPRSEWETTLSDGARVEVVTAVQGG